MADDKDLDELAKTTNDDFYDLLGVAFDADEKTIRRAWRQASLKVHPDKNPDNKEAADKFIRLGYARDILSDVKLKGEYDRQRQRKRAKAEQHAKMDSKRRAMVEDLERREEAAREAREIEKIRAGTSLKRPQDMTENELLEVKILKLQEDGRRRRKEYYERVAKREREEQELEEAAARAKQQKQQHHQQHAGHTEEIDRTIKLRFIKEGDAATWDKQTLSTLFSKYGPVEHVIWGKDKKVRMQPDDKHRKLTSTVYITYSRIHHSHRAVQDAKSDFPALESVSWASKAPDLTSAAAAAAAAPSTPIHHQSGYRTVSSDAIPKFTSFKPATASSSSPAQSIFSKPSTPSFEDVTLMRLREAHKKREEERIRREEAAEDEAQAAAKEKRAA